MMGLPPVRPDYSLAEALVITLVPALMTVGIAAFELSRPKARRPFDFLSIFNAFFVLFYVFAFAATALKFDAVTGPEFSEAPYRMGTPQCLLALIVGYACVVAGFYARSPRRLGERIQITRRFRWRGDLIATLGLAVFGLISIYLYANSYRSVMFVIANAEWIRSGAGEPGPLVFFKVFMPVMQFASLMLLILFLEARGRLRRTIAAVLFLASLPGAAFTLILLAGRINLIVFVLVFVLTAFARQGRINPVPLGATGVVSVIIFFVGDTLFVQAGLLFTDPAALGNLLAEEMSAGNLGGRIVALTGIGMHRIASLEAVLEHIHDKPSDLRFFRDWLYALVALLPNGLTGIDAPPSVVMYNTDLLLGKFDRTVPPGFIAMGLWSLSWPGLVVYSLLFGWVGRWLQTILIKNWDTSYLIPVVFVLMAMTWGNDLQNGAPLSFLKNSIPRLIVVFVIVFVTCRVGLRPRRRTGVPPLPAAPPAAR